MSRFDEVREALDAEYRNIEWLPTDLTAEETDAEFARIEEEWHAVSPALAKAKCFALLLERGPVAVDKEDIFQEKIYGRGKLAEQRDRWRIALQKEHFWDDAVDIWHKWIDLGAYLGQCDFGHNSPNSALLCKVGFPGLLERIDKADAAEGLTAEQKEFYESCRICLKAMIRAAERLGDAVSPYNAENAAALHALARRAPETTYEVLQLLVLYFFLHEYIAGTRVRTLGRLDVLLTPFIRADLAAGRATEDEIDEMLRFFLNKFSAAAVPFNLPLCLGGIGRDGQDVTNEVTYKIVSIFSKLDIYSPKIHIRVSRQTPDRLIREVARSIRGGNSSFVFVNDEVMVEGLKRVGIEEEDARDYVPIGCYEPAVWGMEMGCTGNGYVNLGKALECVFTDGKDLATGEICGLPAGRIESYEDFLAAVKRQIAYMTDRATDMVVRNEKLYPLMGPDPILSAQYDESVRRGADVYAGGAKYNNSSISFAGIATMVDSLCAMKRFVFDEKQVTYEQMKRAILTNWDGCEALRLAIRRTDEKYGNGNETADGVMTDMTRFLADLLNNRPNGRGGVFKSALYSIDRCFAAGALTCATPDGRRAGEPISKNLCASVGMDRNTVTALIGSVCRIDHADFANGSVLDVVLHPSAVSGEDGLDAFTGLIRTYLNMGGFALHGNVFSSEDLHRAQEDPERYKTLQVRLCGWNVYFNDLSRVEQDSFIAQAENG